MNEQDVKYLWRNRVKYQNESMHVYLHAPFCVGICKYCMYNSTEMKDCTRKEYDNYFNNLLNQVRDFKEVLEYNPIDSLYFGGGTPSIMPFNTLKEIANAIPNWNKIRVKVFEANPISTTKGKIDILSDLGFTYISFGVQTLDKNELERQNRRPPKDGHLKEISKYAIDKGMHINYDIMTLINEDLDKDMDRLYNDLVTIMKEYKPNSIDIYPADQELNDISNNEKLTKVKAIRRTITKAGYFNKDYHISGGMEKLSLTNEAGIIDSCKSNYHLLNIPDEVYWTERKAYSCSGPETAPKEQNVISFGGFRDAWVYSYSSNKDFVYYSQIDPEGNVKYIEGRG